MILLLDKREHKFKHLKINVRQIKISIIDTEKQLYTFPLTIHI